MGGCIGTARDGTSHSGESSDVSGTIVFYLSFLQLAMQIAVIATSIPSVRQSVTR